MAKGEYSRGDYSPIVSQIKYTTLMIRAAIDMEREMEIVGGIPNFHRAATLYYPTARQLQETEDGLFEQLNGMEYKKINTLFGPSSERWEKTIATAKQVKNILQQEGIPAIVDCRAKSNFSLWQKMQRYDIDPDEIFDALGIRTVARNAEEAYLVRDMLLKHYEFMPEYQFRRLRKIHLPMRDSLNNPKESRYAALHLNFLSEEKGIFEAQITTKDAFIAMHREPEVPALTILSYK